MNMENRVQIEADTFKLVATQSNNKVYFKLWDLIDFVVYEREYTEKDVGAKINRKAWPYLYDSIADLKDIFELEGEKCEEDIKAYIFGTVYKTQK